MLGSCIKRLPFLIASPSPKDEDLHVNERSREQISFTYGPYERGEMNHCGGNGGCKCLERLCAAVEDPFS